MRLLPALLLLLLLPVPALAETTFDCTAHTLCVNDSCNPLEGLALRVDHYGEGAYGLLAEEWTINLLQAAADTPDGTFNAYEPYGAEGRTSILMIDASGQMVLSTLTAGTPPEVTTVRGDCAGAGG